MMMMMMMMMVMLLLKMMLMMMMILMIFDEFDVFLTSFTLIQLLLDTGGESCACCPPFCLAWRGLHSVVCVCVCVCLCVYVCELRLLSSFLPGVEGTSLSGQETVVVLIELCLWYDKATIMVLFNPVVLSPWRERDLAWRSVKPLYCLLSAICCLLFAVYYLLSAVCCLLSGVCCLLFAVCCLLSAVCCLLSAVCCLLSAVCCLLSPFLPGTSLSGLYHHDPYFLHHNHDFLSP
jgi:hypothetical protein